MLKAICTTDEANLELAEQRLALLVKRPRLACRMVVHVLGRSIMKARRHADLARMRQGMRKAIECRQRHLHLTRCNGQVSRLSGKLRAVSDTPLLPLPNPPPPGPRPTSLHHPANLSPFLPSFVSPLSLKSALTSNNSCTPSRPLSPHSSGALWTKYSATQVHQDPRSETSEHRNSELPLKLCPPEAACLSPIERW